MNAPLSPSGLDRMAVWRQFDRRLADAADFLAPEIALRMNERLSLIKLDPRRMLDIGCGLGHARAMLQGRWPAAHYVGLDRAPRRIARSAHGRSAPRDGWARWRPITSRTLGPAYVVADAHHVPFAAQSFDLLWSNAVLHWLDEPAKALAEWQRVLRPQGALLFSAWGVDTWVELRRAGVSMPSWPDMHDLGDALVKAGFADPVMETERLTLSWSNAQRFWIDLRALGGNALQGRGAGCRTPRQAQQAQQALWDGLCAAQGRDTVALSVEVIYGHAWCVTRRPVTEVPIRWWPRAT